MPEAAAEANGDERGAGGAEPSAAHNKNGERSNAHAEGVGERGSVDWYIRTLCDDNVTLSPAGLAGIVLVAATVGFGLSAWCRSR
jgi:hypothetical protein